MNCECGPTLGPTRSVGMRSFREYTRGDYSTTHDNRWGFIDNEIVIVVHSLFAEWRVFHEIELFG